MRSALSNDSRGRRTTEWVAFGLVVFLVVGPILADAMGLGSGGWARVFGDGHQVVRLVAVLARSVLLASGVAAVALVLGTLLAVMLGLFPIWGRSGCLLVHIFPLFVPPFFSALGWFQLFRLLGLGPQSALYRFLFSAWGYVVVLGLAYTPAVTGLTLLGIRGVDRELQDAGLVQAGFLRVVSRVVLPLARPQMALAGLLVFALSMAELGVSSFLRVRTYPLVVFSRLAGIRFEPGEAVLLMIPLFVVLLFVLVLERRLVGRKSFASLSVGSDGPRSFHLGRHRWLISVMVWALALFGELPVLVILVQSGLSGLEQAWTWMGPTLGNSIEVCLTTATLATALGVIVGHALARRRGGANLADGVAMLGFLAPGALFGVGLQVLWNRPATNFLYSSLWVVVLGLLGRYVVLAERTVAASVVRVDRELEDAGFVSSGYWRVLSRITVPIHRRAVVAAWLFVAVFALRDLATVVTVYPPGGETLVVRIFTLEANGPPKVVAGLAAMQVLVTGLAVALGLAAMALGEGRNRGSAS